QLQSLSTPSGVATSDATSDLRVRRTHQAGALAALDISKPHGNFAGYSSIDCRAVLMCRLRAALFELDLPPTAQDLSGNTRLRRRALEARLSTGYLRHLPCLGAR